MSFVVVLGWVAAAISAAVSLPQLIRLMRSGTSAGLSLLMWQLTMCAGAGWTFHGLLTERPNVWLPNLVLGVCSMLVVRLIARDRGLPALKVWLLPAVIITTLIGIDVVLGATAYGVATSVPQVIGAGAQLIAIAASRDIRGVSPFYVTLATVVQMAWLWWGLLAGDNAIAISASATLSVVGTTLVWYLLRRIGLIGALGRDRGSVHAGTGHDVAAGELADSSV